MTKGNTRSRKSRRVVHAKNMAIEKSASVRSKRAEDISIIRLTKSEVKGFYSPHRNGHSFVSAINNAYAKQVITAEEVLEVKNELQEELVKKTALTALWLRDNMKVRFIVTYQLVFLSVHHQ
jgi:hypothetical protein